MTPSDSRMSLTAATQASASSSFSSNRPPSSGTVSRSCCAAARLASMISGSWRLRRAALRPPAGSGTDESSSDSMSGLTKSGSSRLSVRSRGGSVLPVFIPVISSSSSAGEDDSRSSSSPIIAPARFLSRAASWEARADRNLGPFAVSTRFHLRTGYRRCPRRSAVLLHRRPQSGGVQLGHVDLHVFPAARRHHRLSLVVHLQHQLGGMRLAVAEELLEHIGHIGHQVDGVVPHDRDPGTGRDVYLSRLSLSGSARLSGRCRNNHVVHDTERQV